MGSSRIFSKATFLLPCTLLHAVGPIVVDVWIYNGIMIAASTPSNTPEVVLRSGSRKSNNANRLSWSSSSPSNSGLFKYTALSDLTMTQMYIWKLKNMFTDNNVMMENLQVTCLSKFLIYLTDVVVNFPNFKTCFFAYSINLSYTNNSIYIIL